MKTEIQYISKVLSAVLTVIIFLSGCGQSEIENIFKVNGDKDSGEPVSFSISLLESPEYNNEPNGTSHTRSGEPLIAEWVKVNSFSATRSAEEYEGPAIAAMELFEDSVSATPQTRGVMTAGFYFRLIAFKKSGSSYVFQSVADYTSGGSGNPVLQQGKIICSVGQTYRFVAYSFNNNSSMGGLPGTYTWNSTTVAIPDLNNDFLTFDSGDKIVSGDVFNLPISFTHRLCKLTVKIAVTGFSNNIFTGCTGVYVKGGGSSSSWLVGANGINANTSNTELFNIPDNGTNSVRLVPFANSRLIIVHFGALTVGGGRVVNNIDITSSTGVQLAAGKSYTMTVQLKRGIGIQVKADDINLGGTVCTASDKTALSQLMWANGNLTSTGDTDYEWALNSEDRGYYYKWAKLYTDTSGDPCFKLKSSIYGTGWRTPTETELTMLSRCTNTGLTNNGRWFMNATKGLFLPAAGNRSYSEGSGTLPTVNDTKVGHYWSSNNSGSQYGRLLRFDVATTTIASNDKNYGFSVRCVKKP